MLMWAEVIGVFLFSIVVVRFARRVALEKSAARYPERAQFPQAAGAQARRAAFMPVVLLAVGLLGPRAGLPAPVFFAFLGGAVALYAVSLADDFLTLSTTVRFAVQFAAAFAFLWAIWQSWPPDAAAALSTVYRPLSTAISPQSTVYWLLAIWLVGTLNIYNFMDGIDGIAGLQAVVAGIAWCIFGTMLSAPSSPSSVRASPLAPLAF